MAILIIPTNKKLLKLTYKVFIKYCVFSLECDYSDLCQFCCSAGVLLAIMSSVYIYDYMNIHKCTCAHTPWTNKWFKAPTLSSLDTQIHTHTHTQSDSMHKHAQLIHKHTQTQTHTRTNPANCYTKWHTHKHTHTERVNT